MAAKKKATKEYGSKTNFVMGLPRDLSAKDVVKQAKAQGIVISEAHVYKIRSTNKDKARPGRKTKVPARTGRKSGASAAKASGSESAEGMSKRDFVLSFDVGTPAAEVLAKAKAAGISLSKAYLYTIRSGAGATRSAKTGRTAKASPVRGRNANASLEAQLIDAALDMGLSRATALLERVRSKLKEGL